MRFGTFCAAVVLLYGGDIFANVKVNTAGGIKQIPQILAQPKKEKSINNRRRREIVNDEKKKSILEFERTYNSGNSEKPYIFEGDEFYDAREEAEPYVFEGDEFYDAREEAPHISKVKFAEDLEQVKVFEKDKPVRKQVKFAENLEQVKVFEAETLDQEHFNLVECIRSSAVKKAKKIIDSVTSKEDKDYLLNSYDEKGYTPLWIAFKVANKKIKESRRSYHEDNLDTKKATKDMIHLLIGNGADISKTFLNVIAYSEGKENIDYELIEALLNNGAKANAKFGNGSTVLVEVILGNFSLFDKVRLVRMLLEYGADPNRPDGRGRTPYYYADGLCKEMKSKLEQTRNASAQDRRNFSNSESIKRILIDYGAKEEHFSTSKVLNVLSNKLNLNRNATFNRLKSKISNALGSYRTNP